MSHNIWIYILIMFGVSYLIRSLPITLIRRPIKNRFINSFLYYMPYVTLSVMTFPAIIYATQSVWSGIGALVIGIIVAFIGGNLPVTAAACCVTVFLMERFV